MIENRTVPVGSILGGGPGGALTNRTSNQDIGAQQVLKSGGVWMAQFSTSRVWTNSQFSALNPQYNNSLSFQFRQPLVRNFSIDDLRRKIKIADKRVGLSDLQFRQKVIETVYRVQRAYWDVVYSNREVEIRKDSVKLARTQLERNRRMVTEGTLAQIELVSVEVELERRNEALLMALEGVTRAENALKLLILPDRSAPGWNQPIVPTDNPDEKQPTYSLDEAMNTALAKRPEVSQTDLISEMNKTEIKFLENQTRPQVDLFSAYASTGLSGKETSTLNPFSSMIGVLFERVNLLSERTGLDPLSAGFDSRLPDSFYGGYGQSLGNMFKNDFRTLRFGITISFPLRNRTAEGLLGRALAEERKIDSQRRMLEQYIEAEVRNAVQSLETTSQRLQAARASKEAAQKQLDSEQRRFLSGLSTTYFILERQNALSEAQGRELRALTDYNKATAEMQRVMGTTLVSANVELTTKKK
jgi:HAE1 family hydrophobic/amphiphilic exporter-1